MSSNLHMTSFPPSDTGIIQKKKRRPAGTPDPDAEVVSLSPRTLLESDRYVCEICNQGFQRDQNLQMHRRRHKVPWKLLKREPPQTAAVVKKRVFVCPEASCLHHDPGHALGDLVGIKKHYRRKHSDRRQWVCSRCSKAYAVQSDYKAHLKTCGTRGHTCDCGKVFSRVESFIEHQDSCNANRFRPDAHQIAQPLALSRTASSPSPSPSKETPVSSAPAVSSWSSFLRPRNLELQLLPTSTANSRQEPASTSNNSLDSDIGHLRLSLGPSSADDSPTSMSKEARLEARRQVELAEQEYANAKRIRRQAQAELEKALTLREHAAKSVNSMLLEITCQSCKLKMWPTTTAASSPQADDNSVAASVVTYGGELK